MAAEPAHAEQVLPLKILVVDDNVDMANSLAKLLEQAGHTITMAHDGLAALAAARRSKPDAVVLDIGLPGPPQMGGLELLARWRAGGRATPVLILTARDTVADRIAGLDRGADDYLVKPFDLGELLARLRALVRRAAGHATAELVCGPVRLDTRSARVSVRGQPVRLTAQEYRLLAYLMHHPGRVVSRTELTEHLYQQDFDRDSNTIEVFVTRIRKKLGADIITTIRGLGYQLDDPQG
jgi:two-component system OmpR family response regulator